jgi:hypothetical protein
VSGPRDVPYFTDERVVLYTRVTPCYSEVTNFVKGYPPLNVSEHSPSSTYRSCRLYHTIPIHRVFHLPHGHGTVWIYLGTPPTKPRRVPRYHIISYHQPGRGRGSGPMPASVMVFASAYLGWAFIVGESPPLFVGSRACGDGDYYYDLPHYHILTPRNVHLPRDQNPTFHIPQSHVLRFGRGVRDDDQEACYYQCGASSVPSFVGQLIECM